MAIVLLRELYPGPIPHNDIGNNVRELIQWQAEHDAELDASPAGQWIKEFVAAQPEEHYGPGGVDEVYSGNPDAAILIPPNAIDAAIKSARLTLLAG